MRYQCPRESAPLAQLQARLSRCANLPGPTGVAARLITLSREPDIEFDAFLDLANQAPALRTRLLKVANSPAFSGTRRIDNLRQALIAFGIDGTFNLGLGLTLADSLRRLAVQDVDLAEFWRRSLLGAVAARWIGHRLVPRRVTELYLAGLLQDLGVLALARACPQIYAGIPSTQRGHRYYRDRELAALSVDHAAAGAWLLRHWGLPAWLVEAVANSHRPPPAGSAAPALADCLWAASALANLLLEIEAGQAPAEPESATLGRFLGLDADAIPGLLRSLREDYRSMAPEFELDSDDAVAHEAMTGPVRERLIASTPARMPGRAARREPSVEPVPVPAAPCAQANRDALTGVYNREHLDGVIRSEFDRARQYAWPVSVLLVDLDDFRLVNDRFGQACGDRVLVRLAGLLSTTLRDGDLLARDGGARFAVLLAGTDVDEAAGLAERLLRAVGDGIFCAGNGRALTLTASIGCATLNDSIRFDSPRDLLAAADAALSAVKRTGRNGWSAHRPG